MTTGASRGKPIFPTIPEMISEDLFQHVGPSSFQFFNIMRLDPGFLSLPVEICELDSSFNETKLTDSNLMVVKNGAERCVKLCHEQQASSSRRVSYTIFCRKWRI